jgi:lysylphosphatidylglycerol synthetase-like protein (DUF2156 family)
VSQTDSESTRHSGESHKSVIIKLKRVRRIAFFLLFLTGAVEIASSVTPPLRQRIHALQNLLPTVFLTSAAALTVILGLLLIFLARAIRRGNHAAWIITIILLCMSIVFNITKGLDFEESILSLAALIFFLIFRHYFGAKSDLPSIKSGVLTLIIGALIGIFASTLAIEGTYYLHNHRHKGQVISISFAQALLDSLSRMVGIDRGHIYDPLGDFLNAGLLGLSIGLIIIFLVLAFRPIVERSYVKTKEEMAKMKTFLSLYPNSTLDYFSLRYDKKHFITENGFVSYGVFNGICLVSPDPIAKADRRQTIWSDFRKFTDQRGWSIGVIGASQDWLTVYEKDGMSPVYMGDEAVVKLNTFSLEGGDFKGLRQAYNRIKKYGYVAEFINPLDADEKLKQEIKELMPKARRGTDERGFSMTLGRIFDTIDEDLLLTTVKDPNSKTVAFAQFVPAKKIAGYSLDLMRRDPDKAHPNGLMDFVLVSTIYHLKEKGFEALSLNFATWRAIIAKERGTGLVNKVECFLIDRLSSSMQIHSLWHFNAKYAPEWIPRYAVYDSLEHFVPTAIALARAESFTDLPLIGALFRPKRIPNVNEDSTKLHDHEFQNASK